MEASSSVENDQSSPLASMSEMLNRWPCSAIAVSFAAASPITGTVSENVSACGEYTTPTCVRSMLCSASAVVENVGVNEVTGLIWCSTPFGSV